MEEGMQLDNTGIGDRTSHSTNQVKMVVPASKISSSQKTDYNQGHVGQEGEGQEDVQVDRVEEVGADRSK